MLKFITIIAVKHIIISLHKCTQNLWKPILQPTESYWFPVPAHRSQRLSEKHVGENTEHSDIQTIRADIPQTI
jgi:hypothetical protein